MKCPTTIVGRSIVQCVTHLDFPPPEPKSLTLVNLHNISKMTLKNASFTYNGLVALLTCKKPSLQGVILLTRRAHG